ncbi:MAG: tetratricopeptide repeat protein [Treponema sp.]|jgi:tetratricopeptide (TPR) repeat protein|nr:tetratricopeptide repeat protein [Treponema sp.]
MVKNNVLAEGISLFNRNKYTQALTFFLGLPQESGAGEMDLAYYIGLCYARLRRDDDALLYLEQVVTSGTDIQRVLQCRFILAVIYAESGRKRLSEFELGKLLETGYRTASVYASMAYVVWEQGDVDKCLDYYKKSLDKDPGNLTALNGMGYVLACENRELPKALSCCKKALAGAPDSAACLDSLGWVYFKLGLFKDAEKYLLLAAQKKPGNSEIADHLRLVKEARNIK